MLDKMFNEETTQYYQRVGLSSLILSFMGKYVFNPQIKELREENERLKKKLQWFREKDLPKDV